MGAALAAVLQPASPKETAGLLLLDPAGIRPACRRNRCAVYGEKQSEDYLEIMDGYWNQLLTVQHKDPQRYWTNFIILTKRRWSATSSLFVF